MQATYTTSNAGNLALQSERWNVPTTAAKLAVEHLDARVGTYWHSNLIKPLNRAKRAKAESVIIYTAGFSTGEFANVLAAIGCECVAQ